MSNMTAFCGLDCSTCPMYIATKKDDDTLRAAAAKMLEENYGMKYKPEEINCDGCQVSDGRILGYCNTCKVRACGQEKGVAHCALCTDQPCEKLTEFHTFSPDAKKVYDKLLSSL